MEASKPSGLNHPYKDEELCEMFGYYPSFVKDNKSIDDSDVFIDNLSNEVKCLTNTSDSNSKRKTEKIFLATDPSILWFDSKQMSDFTYIPKLCSIVNNHLELEEEKQLNACVVNFYPKGITDGKPHSDNEGYTDTNSPVCTFSIEHNRNFSIYKEDLCPVSSSPPKIKLLKQMLLQHDSLCVMLPPSQRYTRHHVEQGIGERWSISFRRVIKSAYSAKDWPYRTKKSYVSEDFPSPNPTKLISSPTTSASETVKDITNQPISNSQHKPITDDTKLTTNPTPEHKPQKPASVSNDLTVKTVQLIEKIANSDLAACRKLLIAVNNRIQILENDTKNISSSEVDELVSKLPNFPEQHSDHLNISISSAYINDTNVKQPSEVNKLLNKIHTELTKTVAAPGTHPESESVNKRWIIKDEILSDYSFLKSTQMSNSPEISELLDIVNNNDQCVGNLNSCLICYYPNGYVGTRPHSDDEVYICQNSSICNISLGAERDLVFFDKHDHGNKSILHTVSLKDKSMTIMQPSCQLKLKHKVTTDKHCSTPRWCLSFRRLVPVTANIPDIPTNTTADDITNETAISTTIILGDSITQGLNPERLIGKSINTEVINMAVRGAKIQDVSSYIDQLYAGDHEKTKHVDIKNITNIVIAIGTNDIRFKQKGVASLYTPVSKLLNKTKMLFPHTNIYVQSCLPIKEEFLWTVSNVQNFNKLLRRCTRETKGCTYLNVFNNFLDENNRYVDNVKYRDNVHLNKRGLGTLARLYIKIVRNNGICDPYVDLV